MKHETYKCDVCGKVKGETNHWFKGLVEDVTPPEFLLVHWDAGEGDIQWRHFCGIGCALQEISRVMQPSNREPAVPSPSVGSQEVTE